MILFTPSIVHATGNWDRMYWDWGHWYFEFESVTSEADLRQAIIDARAAGGAQGNVLLDLDDILSYETEAIAAAIVDDDGDGLTNTQEIARGTNPNSYQINLVKGWNLMSVSRIPDQNSVTDILGSDFVGAVWIWEDNSFQIADEILPLRGHWVYVTEDSDIDIVITD